MRLIKYKGKVAKIREDDYRKLMDRFDLRNAIFSGYKETDCIIKVKCSLCLRYPACSRCPLEIFESERRLGCKELLSSMVKLDIIYITNRDIIRWDITKDKRARKMIRKVYNALKKLRRV